MKAVAREYSFKKYKDKTRREDHLQEQKILDFIYKNKTQACL